MPELFQQQSRVLGAYFIDLKHHIRNVPCGFTAPNAWHLWICERIVKLEAFPYGCQNSSQRSVITKPAGHAHDVLAQHVHLLCQTCNHEYQQNVCKFGSYLHL